ncbi:MAG: transcription termination/antitermination protein NusA [Gammaproteobacteria bacterium]|nr:transcription termination/antitermination protein NusA [Gammaproteobacteria bacterium]
MNKEILLVVDMVSNEKGVEKEIIFDALECALMSASKKRYGSDMDVRVSIDRESGDYTTFRRWKVVEREDGDQKSKQISLAKAQESHPDIELGGFAEEPIKSVAFGRIAAQTARQVIMQKVREAERAQVIESYRVRVGEWFSAVVKRLEKGSVILDLGGNVEGIILRDELIPREAVRPGDRLRSYLRGVHAESRGPQLMFNRTAPEFLIELFKLEVPEISEDLIEILGAARDPGSRAKIAVRAKDPRLDPVGACVGMRGSRVQAVSNELGGERVDIILWDKNPAKFVINAMAPAEVISIVIDEEAHSMDIAVAEDQLSLAIGKNGQNVQLAGELSGWTLKVMTAAEAEEKNETEQQVLQQQFMNLLDIDENVALILVEEGFSTVEEVAYVPIEEMMKVDEFDADMVRELRERAKDALLTREIATEERLIETVDAPAGLLKMRGMDEKTAQALAGLGIKTPDDLAEQAVGDLMVLKGMDEARAGQLIMSARTSSWFAKKKQG